MNYILNFHLNSNSKFIQQNLELAIKHSLKNLISDEFERLIIHWKKRLQIWLEIRILFFFLKIVFKKTTNYKYSDIVQKNNYLLLQ